MTERWKASVPALLCAGGAFLTGCGGRVSSAPTPNPPPPGAPNTITINLSGVVSPKELQVALGGRVTFVNNDSRTHDMTSDPHPEHTDCPEINSAGFLVPGQSRQTNNFVTAKTCGYHDHDRPTDNALQGRIVAR